MKGLIQRVSQASVEVEGNTIGAIDQGLLVLLGVEKNDDEARADKLLHRITHYRIFNDDNGKMNRSLLEVGGGLLIVSQFTLVADTRKGLRPGFSGGASAGSGEALYQYFVNTARAAMSPVACGQFGADMKVALTNDGPVTFLLET
ncbi:D-tyrosyl-tRNA(Tyr) deacylase [Ketobacter sp. MCCC 1A13808]|uniref:D-aminoacyl-tRNA deacylase n=1 Tax=Ketobacter sp. MCCC 1A13808 TaxID=2602738 RepID=UPI000F16D179|nr:D-aminoacyl-tRNA deacylase [Ketobacter sp. MCCC 1A13808]MVF13143.1 D-tyrosyl-tRNA(Tyr) deacylase [Ketobacter sp. MCCC 1A13808]RLP54789.1 MAG: D-tyrosyl-tRNA(Tyr) deacylase [Ketobacter sp.]